MDGVGLQGTKLIAELGPVLLEALDSLGTPNLVKPTPRQDGANAVNPVLNLMQRGNRYVVQPKATNNFQASLARTQLLGFDVVGKDMRAVTIRPLSKFSDVMVKSVPAVF